MNVRSSPLCALVYGLLAAAACAQDRAQSWAIFVMNRDGSAVRRVVYIESFPPPAAPRWSHDGQRLAFEAHGQRPGRALIIDTNGRNLIDLGAGAKPDWSPDDKQVLFEVPTVGRTTVWV
ncbi:MAG: PD40 domain-containing protein, partial [Planctomycetes bacterium]|nr:PD40 domain-containing protein [Planctomycetota bacterium]